jgi:hypothetical protein
MGAMKTITTEVKHEIIDLVQSGKLNARDAAVRYGIPESLIQSWAGGSTSPDPKLEPSDNPTAPQPYKLASCKACGKQVAKVAKTCPHCGCGRPSVTSGKNAAGILILLAVVALGLLAWFGLEQNTSSSEVSDLWEQYGVVGTEPGEEIIRKIVQIDPEAEHPKYGNAKELLIGLKRLNELKRESEMLLEIQRRLNR